jgi:hypothetical protein
MRIIGLFGLQVFGDEIQARISEHYQVAEKVKECFDELSINGESAIISNPLRSS